MASTSMPTPQTPLTSLSWPPAERTAVLSPEMAEFGRGPPDGGSRAWLVMLGSFFVNGLIFGLMNTYSVLYDRLQQDLQDEHVAGASSKAG